MWAGAHLALQVVAWENARAYVLRPKASADTWRLANRGALRLERCLAAVRARVPEDAVVTFTAPGRDDAAFLFAWAVYFLPERRLVLASDGAREPGLVFSYGSAGEAPRGRTVLETACGTLSAPAAAARERP